jgi:predicted transcriptional regulator
LKALEQYQINDIYQKSEQGMTYGELAAIYHISPATVKNYVTLERARRDPVTDTTEGADIKVIGMTPGKTLNFQNVTNIIRDKQWIHIMSGEYKIGMLVPENVTAIIPV